MESKKMMGREGKEQDWRKMQGKQLDKENVMRACVFEW